MEASFISNFWVRLALADRSVLFRLFFDYSCSPTTDPVSPQPSTAHRAGPTVRDRNLFFSAPFTDSNPLRLGTFDDPLALLVSGWNRHTSMIPFFFASSTCVASHL